MEFVEEVEEEWEKKLQNNEENNKEEEREERENEEGEENGDLKNSNQNITTTTTTTKARRHSSIIMKHGLEILEDNETDIDDKSVITNTTQNTINSDETNNDIFLTLSVKELKCIINNKVKQFSEKQSKEVLQILSTICVKDELREFCKKYVSESEVQELLNIEQNNNNNTNNNNNSNNNFIASTSNTTSPTNTNTNSSNFNENDTSDLIEEQVNLELINQFSSLSVQQIKSILKTRANEISQEDSENLLHLLSISVEKSELIQLCSRYIQSENDFQRLCFFLDIHINTIDEQPSHDSDDNSSGSKLNKNAQRKETFRKMISLTALDDGTCLRGMLYKKGRGRSGFLRPWNERFFILNYTLLTLRYYNISGSTARSLNLDGSTPPEETLKGEISINGCIVKPLPFSATGKSYSFQVVLNDVEAIVLAAHSEDDQKLWIDKLSDATQEREKAVIERRKKLSNVSSTGTIPRQRTSRHSRHTMTRGDSDEASTSSSTSFPPRKSVN